MKTLLHTLSAAIVILSLSACTHHYYAPNPVQVPLLEHKNDAVVALGIGAGNEFKNYDFHGVYSPVKYGAVMANYFKAYSDQAKVDWGKGQLFEGAIGGYYPIPGGSASLFSGYGQGSVFNRYENGATSDLRFAKFFIQPGIAFSFSFFRLGMGIRLTRLNYTSGDIDVSTSGLNSFDDELKAIQAIEKRSVFWLPELGINAGVDLKYIYLFSQLTMINDNSLNEVHFARSLFSTGLVVNLHHFWEKKAPLTNLPK